MSNFGDRSALEPAARQRQGKRLRRLRHLAHSLFASRSIRNRGVNRDEAKHADHLVMVDADTRRRSTRSHTLALGHPPTSSGLQDALAIKAPLAPWSSTQRPPGETRPARAACRNRDTNASAPEPALEIESGYSWELSSGPLRLCAASSTKKRAPACPWDDAAVSTPRDCSVPSSTPSRCWNYRAPSLASFIFAFSLPPS